MNQLNLYNPWLLFSVPSVARELRGQVHLLIDNLCKSVKSVVTIQRLGRYI